MLSYKDLPTKLLVDLLVKETKKILKLYNDNRRTAEYDECLRGIKEIQEIIMSRNITIVNNTAQIQTTDTIY